MELNMVAGGQGRPLVLLHGFTGNHSSWDEWLPVLEKQYSVLAVDLPGHGRSKLSPAGAAADLPAVAAALDQLLENHDIAQADFVGYSMGGRTLLHLAALFPHRVSSMVVLSASPGIEEKAERDRRAESDDVLADRIESEGLATFVTEWMNQPLFATLALANPDRVSRERSRKLAGDAHCFAEALRRMTPGRQPSRWQDLAQMRMPSLIVAGALDEKYVHIAGRMVETMPAAKGAIISGAGHAVLLEQPAETAAVVNAFLETKDTP